MKRLLVVLLLITMLAFLITACFIVNNKTESMIIKNSIQRDKDSAENTPTTNYLNSSDENVELYKKYHQNIEDGMAGVTLDDVFYKNSLIWNKIFYEDDKFAGYYYQIDGLKNKNVQKIVNEKLLKSAMDFCNEHINRPEKASVAYYYNGDVYYYSYGSSEGNYYYLANDYEGNNSIKEANVNNVKMYFEQTILSSFSNVISVATFSCGEGHVGYFSNNYYEYRKDDKYVNIDLNTGNDLSFESIFASNANIKAILYHILYGELASIDVPWTEYIWNEETEKDEKIVRGDNSINGPDLRKIEKVLNTFEHTEKLSFGFTPSQFFVHVGNYFCVKDYNDILEDLAIFKRFLSNDSLFESDDLKIKFAINDCCGNIYSYYNNELDGIVKEGSLSVDGKIDVDYKIFNYSKDFNNKEAADIVVEYLNNNVIEKIKSIINADSKFSSNIKLYLYDTDVEIRGNYWEAGNEKYNELFNNKPLYVICSSGKYEIDGEAQHYSYEVFKIFDGNTCFYVGIDNNSLFGIDNPLEYVMKDYSEDKLKQIGEELWKNFYETSYRKDKMKDYHEYKLEKDKIVFKYQEYYEWRDKWADVDKQFYIITYRNNVTVFYPLENKMHFT